MNRTIVGALLIVMLIITGGIGVKLILPLFKDKQQGPDVQAVIAKPAQESLPEKKIEMPESLKFGVTPYLDKDIMRRGFQPLLKYLKNQTGINFELFIAADYAQLARRMKLKDVDIGVFSPFAYIEGVKIADIRIFASQLTNGGKSAYKGLIITRKSTGIQKIDDLRGKSFAFVDPKSTSGFIYPRAMIIEKGYNPAEFFGEIIFSGNHNTVITDVLDGKADAGAVYDDALDMAQEKKLPVDKLIIIAETAPIPYDAYTAGKDLHPEVVQRIQKVLLKIDRNTAEGKQVLDNELKIDGFIIGNDSRYDTVRKAAAFRREKPRVAVLSFKEMGTKWEVSLSKTISELFNNLLIQSDKYFIIPAHKIQEVTNAQEYDQAIELSSDALKRIDKALNVKILITGSIFHLGEKITISVKLQDVPSGNLKAAATKSGAENQINHIIRQIIDEIGEEYPATGYVIHAGKNKIMIDLGTDDGVLENERIIVFQDGKLLKNPITGEILGRQEKILAEAKVISSSPKVSTCRLVKGRPETVSFGKRARLLRKQEQVDLPAIKGNTP